MAFPIQKGAQKIPAPKNTKENFCFPFLLASFPSLHFLICSIQQLDGRATSEPDQLKQDKSRRFSGFWGRGGRSDRRVEAEEMTLHPRYRLPLPPDARGIEISCFTFAFSFHVQQIHLALVNAREEDADLLVCALRWKPLPSTLAHAHTRTHSPRRLCVRTCPRWWPDRLARLGMMVRMV